PILAGREFLESDRKGAPEVAILNENLARRLFGDRNPVGRTFRYPGPTPSGPITVVGVAANSKYFTLGEESPRAMYSPYSQGGPGSRDRAKAGGARSVGRDRGETHAESPGLRPVAEPHRCGAPRERGAPGAGLGFHRPVRGAGVFRDPPDARDRAADGPGGGR